MIDVAALGGRGYQGFCDDSTKALVTKSVTMGEGGVISYQILRDVIYERYLVKNITETQISNIFIAWNDF